MKKHAVWRSVMRTTRFAAAIVATLLASSAASGAEVWLKSARGEVTVHSVQEFQRALANVKPGDAIALAPGNYPKLTIRNVKPSETIVVRSEDPSRPAQVSGIDIADSQNVWVQQLAITTTAGIGTARDSAMVNVRNSKDIGIVANKVFGWPDGNYGNDPDGVHFDTADNVTFALNEMHDLGRGVVFATVRDARMTENTLYNLRSDGADFAGVQRVEIDGNLFTTFHPIEPDHPDFIQFWTREAKIRDTHSVYIHHNVMLQGAGTGESPQAIFIGNENPGWVYRDFRIENNIIYNGVPHGISLYDVVGARVANNTIVMAPGSDPRMRPKINLTGSRDVEVVANVVPQIGQERSQAIRLDNNIETYAATPGQALHPEQLFLDPNAGPNATALSFAPVPGSRLAGVMPVGALPPLAPAWREELAIVRTPLGVRRNFEVQFDARMNDDPAAAADVIYQWDFGDQNTGEGPVVVHRYGGPGVYPVKLTVRRNGKVIQGVRHVQVGEVALASPAMRPEVSHG